MKNDKRTISVIGLGYVGLPLALAFAKHTRVIGYDNHEKLIADLTRGIDKHSVSGHSSISTDNIHFTHKPEDLATASFHIVAVPTPINEARQPDLAIILSATRTVAAQLKKGDIVVFESTVYPGLTEEECIPILENDSGLRCGQDFFVGYSPERINPGDIEHTLENTIKVVSAQDQATLDTVAETYELVVKAGVHRAPTIKVAEAAKVIENTQRDINISLMNELALIFEKMNIDTSDVLSAAGTKWNFLRFQPGLVGGHCIGVDPYYLTHKAMRLGYSPRVILSGRSTNDAMGGYVARMVVKQLIKAGRAVKGSVVTILGFAFKENIADVRNTKVIDIINELKSFDVIIQIYDPMVDKAEVREEYGLEMTDKKDLKKANAVIFAVLHREFIDGGWDYILELLDKKEGVVFDVKSVLPRDKQPDKVTLQRL